MHDCWININKIWHQVHVYKHDLKKKSNKDLKKNAILWKTTISWHIGIKFLEKLIQENLLKITQGYILVFFQNGSTIMEAKNTSRHMWNILFFYSEETNFQRYAIN